jgi:hypothetical protein
MTAEDRPGAGVIGRPVDPALLRIAQRRLLNSGLWGVPFVRPQDVVGWFGAVQGQDYEPGKWSVAARTTPVTNAELDDLFDGGDILRTHALRPTWHFVLPADIRWIQELTGPRVHALNGTYYKRQGVDESLRSRCEGLFVRWLEQEGELTRHELGERLAVEGIPADGPRLAYVVMSAELNAAICSGRRRGATPTYALVSQRAPDAVEMSREEALAELTLRYFTSHGPATIHDFRWWSSLTLTDIRRGLELVGDRLLCEEIGGSTLWSNDRSRSENPPGSIVQLLQGLDEYTVAYAETKQLVDLAGIAPPPPTDGRAFFNVVIVDGQLAGWWRRTIGRQVIEIEIKLSRPLDAAEQEALSRTAEAYGRFHGRAVTVAGADSVCVPPSGGRGPVRNSE